jgi:hypothetical protein
MKKHSLAGVVALALPLAVSTAHAQDSSAVRISGFGTAALTWSDTDNAEFARPNQASGAGKSPRTGVDSLLGLQADFKVNDWLSLTGQGVVRKDGTNDDYGADLTWAFAKIKLTDQVSARIGRIEAPIFMMSEYRNVGYANTMLRPPREVYSRVPVNHLDGGDITWQQNIVDTTYTAQLAYGRTEGDGSVVTGHSVLNLVAEHGPFTLRFGRDDGTLELKNVPLPKMKVSFTSIGLSMDWNNIVAQSEVAKTTGLGDKVNSWYAMGGYRFGKVLPFYAHAKLTGDQAQSTDTLGLRWDFMNSADIKFQIDHIKSDGNGLFVNVKPGFKGPVTVGAAAVDFVF